MDIHDHSWKNSFQYNLLKFIGKRVSPIFNARLLSNQLSSVYIDKKWNDTKVLEILHTILSDEPAVLKHMINIYITLNLAFSHKLRNMQPNIVQYQFLSIHLQRIEDHLSDGSLINLFTRVSNWSSLFCEGPYGGSYFQLLIRCIPLLLFLVSLNL